jgi:hypothetical protein
MVMDLVGRQSSVQGTVVISANEVVSLLIHDNFQYLLEKYPGHHLTPRA